MTCHLVFAALAMLLAAATVYMPDASQHPLLQPAFVHVHDDANPSPSPGRGFAAAFGTGAVVRNLLY